MMADPSVRAVYGVGLRPLACWDCGFEFRRGHGCLSLASVVCCQVDVSASG
jgi:predicted Zn-ribbon and HTH transcriptional regulator